MSQTRGTDNPADDGHSGPDDADVDVSTAPPAPQRPPVPPPAAMPPPSSAPPGSASPGPSAGPAADVGWGLHGRLLPVRPMRIGELLDGAFRLLRQTWLPSMVIVLVLVGPFDLLSGWVQDLLGFTDLVGADFADFDPNAQAEPASPFTAEDIETLVTTVAVLVGLAALTQLLVAIANGAVTRQAVLADQGRQGPWTEAVGHAFRRFWPLVGSTVLVGLAFLALVLVGVGIVVGLVVALGPPGAVIGGLLAFALIVPGLLLYAVFYLSVPVIVIEDRGPVAALRRSAQLVRPQLWRVVGVAVLTFLALNLAVASIGFVGTVAVLAAGPFAGLVSGLLAVVQRLLILPVSAFVALLLYVDARSRREGLDIEARIAQLPPPMAP